MKGVIYQIKTADGLYVGSTFDFITRKSNHKCDLKIHSDRLLYKNIISNNGIYKIEIYCNVNCRSRRDLSFFEEQYRIILGANLNSRKSFQSVEEIKAYNNQKFICECGANLNSRNKSRHFKTQQHLKYIKDYQTPPL